MTSSSLSRRRALSSAATVGLSLPLLAACGDDASGPAAGATETPGASSSADPEPDATEEPPAGEAGGVVATADVPVGSGVILPDASVVVTQPTEGDIRVLSISCTHTGCAVTGISDTITCPCHGSQFDLTGTVLSGPASAPLPAVDFTVAGDQVVLS